MANEEVLELQIRDNAAVAASGLQELATTLTRVKNAVGKGLNLKGTVSGLEKLKNAVVQGLDDSTINRWEKLANVLERLKGIGALKISGVKNIANQLNITDSLNGAKEAAQDTGNAIENAIDAGLENVDARSAEVSSSMSNAFSNVKDKVVDLSKSVGKDLKEGFENARTSFGNLLGDFGRIVKYRVIRSIIKQITEAFTTGVKNVYMYSKAIGSSFAPAMDDAASVLLQFKNSIGAAVAPLIQQLIPVLKTVVGWAIEAFNYFNQFLALLRGSSTWTKALYKPVNAFEDTKKAAKGAKKEIKDLLADWDELNIIQSESGSGSGGAAKAAEDYTKMFEEEAKFDGWLSDHFKDVLDYIKLAGAALAAWKLSKAFSGILGKLFKLIAGGALVALGVKLSFDAGFDMAQNGLNTGNILQAVGGALAAGIGGYLITSTIGLGGGIGFAIGVGVAVIATLVGYIKGKRDLADKNKWGNLEWTREQIEQFVADQFTFDVVAEIDIIDSAIQGADIARKNLNSAVTKFQRSLKTVKIRADKSPQAIIDLGEEAREVISAANTYISDETMSLETALNLIPIKTEVDSEGLLKNVKLADTQLSTWFTEQGNAIADWIDKGIKNEWKGNEAEMALELMNHLDNIINQAEENRTENQLLAGMKGNISMLSRDNAVEILEREKELMQQYEDSAKKLYEDRIVNLQYKADLAEAIGLIDEESGRPLADIYRDAAKELQENYKKEIDNKLAETRQAMADEWYKSLSDVYGADFQKSLEKYMNIMTNPAWANNDLVQKFIGEGKYGEAGGALRNILTTYFTGDDPNGIVSYVLNDLNGNVFNLLSDEMRSELLRSLSSITNDNEKVLKEILREAFNLTDEDIDELFKIPSNGALEDWADVIEDEDLDLNATVHLEADAEEFKKQLKDELEYAIFDGVITADEEAALRRRFSDALFEQLLDEMGIHTDKYGNVLNGSGNSVLGTRQLASTGMSSAGGYAPTTIDTSDEADAKMKSNIESGMKAANEPQNDLLRSVVSGIDQLVRKQWTINIHPSSGWGNFQVRNNQLFEKITGNP